MTDVSRREALSWIGAGLAAGALAEGCREQVAHAASIEVPPPLTLPAWLEPGERQNNLVRSVAAPDRRYGVALVGLGRLALQEILPAVAQSRFVRVTALVSGSPAKAKSVATQLGVAPSHVLGYADLERLGDFDDVDFVYVLLPNSQHHEFVLRAAKAKKHVLCEKPMATSAREATEMVQACHAANVLLMVAYRMQYTPMLRDLQRRVRSGELGAPRTILAHNGQAEGRNPDDWRLKKALAGGGALPDIGLYCLNTTRFLLGEEPVEVSAQIASRADDPRFREVEESVLVNLRFPSGTVAQLSTSYSSHEARSLQVLGEKGWARLDPAFAYRGLRMQLASKSPDSNRELVTEVRGEEKNQFALELDHFAECIAGNRTPHTPGEEGVQDQQLMETIYRAAAERRTLDVPPVPGRDAFRGPEPTAEE